MTAHTAGPWQVKSEYEPHIVIANVDGDTDSSGTTYSYDTVAACEDEYGDALPEAEANARLIASAPDLLKALEKYGDEMCEGWCDGGPHFGFADCGGCRARRAVYQATKG